MILRLVAITWPAWASLAHHATASSMPYPRSEPLLGPFPGPSRPSLLRLAGDQTAAARRSFRVLDAPLVPLFWRPSEISGRSGSTKPAFGEHIFEERHEPFNYVPVRIPIGIEDRDLHSHGGR